VGRNNRENDHITFRVAQPTDWWFHIKGGTGAHVVARPPDGQTGESVPAETVEDAALLAAYFSRSRAGRNVPVDYTQRRHVRKPRGGRPGSVLYEQYRTVFVTPTPD